MQSILTGRAIGADTVSLPVDGLRTIHGHAGKSYTVSGRRHTVFFAGGGAETCNGAAETGKLTLFAGTKVGASDVLIGGSHNNAFEMDGGAAAATLVGGVFLGSMLWWTILSQVAGTWRSRLTPGMLRGINRLSGAVLGAFGLIAIYLALRR